MPEHSHGSTRGFLATILSELNVESALTFALCALPFALCPFPLCPFAPCLFPSRQKTLE
jgi:hypothetical protein